VKEKGSREEKRGVVGVRDKFLDRAPRRRGGGQTRRAVKGKWRNERGRRKHSPNRKEEHGGEEEMKGAYYMV